MKKMFLLFSHELTEAQKLDAAKIGITNFISLPTELQASWSNISPEIENIKDVLEPIKDWIDHNASGDGDYALIQGDFGAVYYMILYCKTFHSITPVYATTKREFTEIKKDNKIIKTSVFTHVRFREYGV